MKTTTAIRKAVCTIANNLHKTGLTLSEAFKTAWHRVKDTTFRAAGVTAGTRQKSLEKLAQFPLDDLVAGFRREPDNKFDANAVQILVKIKSLNVYCIAGYVPAAIAGQIAAAMDAGIKIKAIIKGVIGGYGFKENYGLLMSLEVIG